MRVSLKKLFSLDPNLFEMSKTTCPVCNGLAQGPIYSYTVEETASHICTL